MSVYNQVYNVYIMCVQSSVQCVIAYTMCVQSLSQVYNAYEMQGRSQAWGLGPSK